MKKRSKRHRKALWAGAFTRPSGRALSRLSVSHPFDRRLAKQDIAGSRAHARGLARAGLLPRKDLARIEKGLARIEREIADGRFVFADQDEDIHLNVERRLIELAGRSGERLHAGRSRNDQVALDLRLWTLEAIGRVGRGLQGLAGLLLDRADEFLRAGIVIAARTHMRSAQPILLAHAFHAYAEMLARDLERMRDTRSRTAVSPLGSGACAGTTLPIDRRRAARELGLSQLSANSLDAVSDRDFAAEFEFGAALAMVHLSRLAEDLILWTGEEYRLFRLSDSSTTGSSMMPQKKNPDSLELARGKAGRVAGDLLASLMVLKGLPLSYNRDLQETQEPLFDAAETLETALDAMHETIVGLEPIAPGERAPMDSQTLATDIAEALVSQGVPFRRAHEIVARWSLLAAQARADLREIAAVDAPALRPFLSRLTPESAVARRDIPGGTAPRRVRAAIARTRSRLRYLGGSVKASR
ncbi:MAG TPA: argininosuccinate lyase [Thermoanaerobaculia bacterium]|nr:argininosuccinate lyase [Thermoanaerobaculia bacterium]